MTTNRAPGLSLLVHVEASRYMNKLLLEAIKLYCYYGERERQERKDYRSGSFWHIQSLCSGILESAQSCLWGELVTVLKAAWNTWGCLIRKNSRTRPQLRLQLMRKKQSPTLARIGGCLVISVTGQSSRFVCVQTWLGSSLVLSWSILVMEWPCLMLIFCEIIYVHRENTKAHLWVSGVSGC